MVASKHFGLAAILALGCVVSVPVQAADASKLLGSFSKWYAYSTGSGASQVCYALSQPTGSLPKGVKRDPIFFLISTWPGKKVAHEPSVMPGYQYKEGAKPRIQVGSDKFDFFSKNDGNNGGAWLEDPADERRLIDTMKHGSSLTVTGTSQRGTLTTDTFSLAGISAAIDKIDASCK